MAGFQVDMSPLVNSSINMGNTYRGIGQQLGGSIQNAGNMYAQKQQQEQQLLQQQNTQDELNRVKSAAMGGNEQAFELLMTNYPGEVQGVAEYLQQKMTHKQEQNQYDQQNTEFNQSQTVFNQEQAERQEGIDAEAKKAANQATVKKLHDVKLLPADKQDAALNEIIGNETDDFGPEELAMYKADPDEILNRATVEYYGEDLAKSMFGIGGDAIKQQELDIKQEANDIRRLENKERALDRQLARETNELKRQQLEDKIVDTKTKKESKINDVKVEGERAIVDIDDATSVASAILAHPGLDASVGGTSLFPTIPGSDASNFESKLEQFKSKQFLTNIQKMKGMGSLSEAEGKKIAAAAGALDLNMSEDAFRAEMQVIIDGLKKAKTFINKKYGNTGSSSTNKAEGASNPAPQAALQMLQQNPAMREQFKAKYGYLPEGM